MTKALSFAKVLPDSDSVGALLRRGWPLVEEAAARADEVLRTHVVGRPSDGMAAESDAVIERYASRAGAPAARLHRREVTP